MRLFAQSPLPTDSLALLYRADSLFATGAYGPAGKLYEQFYRNHHRPTDPVLLKLAYIQEKEGEIARLLYFLQLYFDRRPDEAILRKMHDVAHQHNLKGYETDDLNYFYLFYKQYGLYVVLALVLLGTYAFGVFWMKFFRQEPTLRRHKFIVLLYLLGVLLLVNLPERYQSGIINQEHVLLRREPSSAAPVVEIVGKGHKVNIIGSRDIWLRVFWNDGLYYVRKDNVWVI